MLRTAHWLQVAEAGECKPAAHTALGATVPAPPARWRLRAPGSGDAPLAVRIVCRATRSMDTVDHRGLLVLVWPLMGAARQATMITSPSAPAEAGPPLRVVRILVDLGYNCGSHIGAA